MPSKTARRQTADNGSVGVAVVVPAFRTARRTVDLVGRFDASVSHIFVVDDCCPERTGELVRDAVDDPRVSVLFNARNLGVGGASIVGFRAAFHAGADIVAKVDGDGQHRAEWLSKLVAPIVRGDADLTKGNRFAAFADCLRRMPAARLVANLIHSAVCRPATGYWTVADPACGFLAVHRKIVGRLPWDRIDRGYFFESDLLFRAGMLEARVQEIPVDAVYPAGADTSGVRLWREVVPFACKSLRNLARRIGARCSARRTATTAVLILLVGAAALAAATGAVRTFLPSVASVISPWIALNVIAGAAVLAAFVRSDIRREPSQALHPRLRGDGEGHFGKLVRHTTNPSAPGGDAPSGGQRSNQSGGSSRASRP